MMTSPKQSGSVGLSVPSLYPRWVMTQLHRETTRPPEMLLRSATTVTTHGTKQLCQENGVWRTSLHQMQHGELTTSSSKLPDNVVCIIQYCIFPP